MREEVKRLLIEGRISELDDEDGNRVASSGEAQHHAFIPVLSGLHGTQNHNKGQILAVELGQTKFKHLELEKAKGRFIQLVEEVVSNFRLAGDSYYMNHDFGKSLDTYARGLKYVSPSSGPDTVGRGVERRWERESRDRDSS